MTELQLERVLGSDATRSTCLAISKPSIFAGSKAQHDDENKERCLVAYPAGAIVVLYDAIHDEQMGFVHSSPFNDSQQAVGQLSLKLDKQNVWSTDESGRVSCLTFDASGRVLAFAVGGSPSRIVLWSVQLNKQLRELSNKQVVKCLAFSPNSRLIVSVGSIGPGQDCVAYVWLWEEGKRVASCKPMAKVECIAFDPLGTFFMTAGEKHAKFWYFPQSVSSNSASATDAASLRNIDGRSAILAEHKTCTFNDLVIQTSDSATFCYAVTESALLVLFNQQRYLEKWVELKMDFATCIDVCAKYIVCGGANGIIRLFEPVTLQYIATLPNIHRRFTDLYTGNPAELSGLAADSPIRSKPVADVLSLRIIQDTELLVAVYNDGSSVTWNIKTPKQATIKRSYLNHSETVWGCEAIPGTQFGTASFASCSSDGTVRFWSLDKYLSDSSAADNGFLEGVDPMLLQVLYADSAALEQPLLYQHGIHSNQIDSSQKETKGIREGAGIKCLKFSPDATLLALGDRSGNIRAFEFGSLHEAVFLQAHSSEVVCLSFHKPTPSTLWLASGGRDGVIHIFDASNHSSDSGTLTPLQTISEHSSIVTGIIFCTRINKSLGNKSSNCLVSCSGDKTVVFREYSSTNKTQSFSIVQSNQMRSNVYDIALVDDPHSVVVAATQDKRICVFSTDTCKLGSVFKLQDLLINHQENQLKTKPASESSKRDNISSTNFGPSTNQSSHSSTFVKRIATWHSSDSGVNCSHVAAIALSDKTIRIFDLQTGSIVATAYGHSDDITGLCFIDGGKRLVSCSKRGIIFIWRLMNLMTDEPQKIAGIVESASANPVKIGESTKPAYEDVNVGESSMHSSPISVSSSHPSLLAKQERVVTISETPPLKQKEKPSNQSELENESVEPLFDLDDDELPGWARSSKESLRDDVSSIRSVERPNSTTSQQQAANASGGVPVKGRWAERLEAHQGQIQLFNQLNPIDNASADKPLEGSHTILVANVDSWVNRRRFSIESQQTVAASPEKVVATEIDASHQPVVEDNHHPVIKMENKVHIDTSAKEEASAISDTLESDEETTPLIEIIYKKKYNYTISASKTDVEDVSPISTSPRLGIRSENHDLAPSSNEKSDVASNAISNRSTPIPFGQYGDVPVATTPNQSPPRLFVALSSTNLKPQSPKSDAECKLVNPLPITDLSSKHNLKQQKLNEDLRPDIALFKRLADKFAARIMEVSQDGSGDTGSSNTRHTVADLEDAMRYVHSIASRCLPTGQEDTNETMRLEAVTKMIETYSDILVSSVKQKLTTTT